MEESNNILGNDPLYNLDDIIGMSYEDAVIHVRKGGHTWRMVRKDSMNYIITCDLRLDRVNLEVENEVVVKYSMG